MISISIDKGIATAEISNEKGNLIRDEVVKVFLQILEQISTDNSIRALVITGHGDIFSRGLDITDEMFADRELFREYLLRFTSLYTRLFYFSRPVVAAINGDSILGGYMIALTADYRVSTDEDIKIGLKEISFGSTIPAGVAVMLKHILSPADAGKVLYEGKLYNPEEALRVGMIDEICGKERLLNRAREIAHGMAAKDGPAFGSIKRHLRRDAYEKMLANEPGGIEEFLNVKLDR